MSANEKVAVQGQGQGNAVVVHALSDATGNTAAGLVEAAAVQFPCGKVGVSRLSHVESIEQVKAYLDRYVPLGEETIVYHTVLNPELRREVRDEAERRGIASVDLLGPAMGMLGQMLGEEPLNVPGLVVDRAGRVIRTVDARLLS